MSVAMPNDLSEVELVYYREYTECGGPGHAAKAYAQASATRDEYKAVVDGFVRDAEADGAVTQQMWAAFRIYEAASKTAEQLREKLPLKTDAAPDTGGFFTSD